MRWIYALMALAAVAWVIRYRRHRALPPYRSPSSADPAGSPTSEVGTPTWSVAARVTESPTGAAPPSRDSAAQSAATDKVAAESAAEAEASDPASGPPLQEATTDPPVSAVIVGGMAESGDNAAKLDVASPSPARQGSRPPGGQPARRDPETRLSKKSSQASRVARKTPKTAGASAPPKAGPASSDVSPRRSRNYVGNKTSRVFHAASAAQLPGEGNREYFATADEAIAAGYRPAGSLGLDTPVQ